MRLLLARHGESTWNAQGRYQGRKDPPLSERGLAQALRLADALSSPEIGDDRPARIIASPLQRARRTAEIAAQRLGLGVASDERLIEISHGAWEGLLKSEIEARWPVDMAAWQRAPETVTFPGGESLADVRRRWLSFLPDVGRQGGPVLIVTHDVVVRIAVLQARGLELAVFPTVAAENAALSRFDYADGVLRLASFNDASYLSAVRSDPSAQAL